MRKFYLQKMMSIIPILLGLILVLSACAPAAAPAFALEIDEQKAYEMREQGALVLDVREPHEWEAGHIPGAILIPLGELKDRIDELPQDQDIIVVCRSGNRSATGRDILIDAGLTQVTSMAGGMKDWFNEGYEMVMGP
jgi:rhodanese-related sulfurtransferase